MYSYKGNTPVKHRDKVMIRLDLDTDVWVEGKVGEALATQFTAVHGTRGSRRVGYFFYKDEGLTWKQS